MTSDNICIHQGEDGTVCGHGFNLHRLTRDGSDSHPFVPGRKCPTCDGSGEVEWLALSGDVSRMAPCPTCADRPVRGHVAL